MIQVVKSIKSYSTSYLQFNRKQWASLPDSIPSCLSEEEIIKLKGINEALSLNEVAEIYLPLSRLINYFYINYNLYHQLIVKQLLNSKSRKIPYIIGIAGSVAVGKSTTARVLQALLSRWPEHRSVELVTTDGFLHSNQILKQRDLMEKKGFPESYDILNLVNFISKVKSGIQMVTAPIYSHLMYDIIPNKQKIIFKPDILILEGLNILQNNKDYKQQNQPHIFISDFIDFSIYVDAPEDLLQSWYVNRFLKFRQGAFSDPNSYFHNYSQLSEQEAIKVSSYLWTEINGRNLKQNILPTRERANLILGKCANHVVDKVYLRK